MAFIKLDENNVVIQKQPNAAQGFIEAPEHVFCGQVYDIDTGTFFTPDPVYSLEDRQKFIELSIQQFLDLKARERGYDNILSACTYAAYTNPFQAEGQAYVEWRGNVWAYCYQVLADVQAQTRAEPTIDELIAELQTNIPLSLT